MRGAAKRGSNILAGEEQDGNFAEDEECAEFARIKLGPGCTIADPGGCDFDGREEDRGNGQSVPTPKLPVFALEPNIFIDKRVRLD